MMLVCVYRTLTSTNLNIFIYNNLSFILIYSISRELYLRGDIRQMVLDLLIWIRSYIDRTLVFRSSCCEGVCGSCAMLINNSNTLACIQPIWLILSYIIIYPLPHFNIIRDLVIDLKYFYEQYAYINPFHYAYDASGFNDMVYNYFVLYFLRLRGYTYNYLYSLSYFKSVILYDNILIYDFFGLCCFLHSVVFDNTINSSILNKVLLYNGFYYSVK